VEWENEDLVDSEDIEKAQWRRDKRGSWGGRHSDNKARLEEKNGGQLQLNPKMASFCWMRKVV